MVRTPSNRLAAGTMLVTLEPEEVSSISSSKSASMAFGRIVKPSAAILSRWRSRSGSRVGRGAGGAEVRSCGVASSARLINGNSRDLRGCVEGRLVTAGPGGIDPGGRVVCFGAVGAVGSALA